jgi:hypothetical protein
MLLPPRRPHLKAHGERCIRSSKEEALNQMLMVGKRSLHDTLSHDLAHDHTKRNHQSLDIRLIVPEPAHDDASKKVVHRDRLGWLLSDYDREAA